MTPESRRDRAAAPAAAVPLDRRRLVRLVLGAALALPAAALAGCAGSGQGAGAGSGRDTTFRGGGTRGHGDRSNDGGGGR